MTEDVKKIIDISKTSMTSSLNTSEWWKHVSRDVKTNILLIVNNIEQLGIPFKNAFTSVFTLQQQKRKLSGKNIKNMTSVLFGKKLTEEDFQCGVVAVKASMDLDDWIMPTECDVYICRHLCNQIAALENLEILPIKYDDPPKVSKTLMPRVEINWESQKAKSDV